MDISVNQNYDNNNTKTDYFEEKILVRDNGKSSSKENQLNSFRNYEIYFIDKNEKMNLKCFRRYRNFVDFHRKLINSYPYLNLFVLPPKNIKSKLNLADETFYADRERILQLFLNHLLKLKEICNSQEFYKFLNDSEFDEEFFSIKTFNILVLDYDSSPILKGYESIKNMVVKYFTKNIKKVNQTGEKILDEKNNLENFNNSFEILKNQFDSLIVNYKEEKEMSESFGSHLLYLQSELSEKTNIIYDLSKGTSIFNEITEKLKLDYNAEVIKNSIEFILLLLKGLIKTINRYAILIQHIDALDEQIKSEKSNEKKADLEKSKKLSSFFIVNFEENLISDLKDFKELTQNFMNDFIEHVILFMKTKV